ncbi:hypothetical protein [Nonomuraea sp. NPDC048916]|uniref:hypothetical protein n=1 Tax=Nonomuraea sp. NPDC048916 TaxID=3154232 RepID=UPI0033DE9CEE
MKLFTRAYQLPPRIATGAYILNSGLNKAKADQETAVGLLGMAAGTYPFLRGKDPEQFVKLLSKVEIAVGVALLIPAVPSLVAGAALTAFAGGLLGLYLKTPGMRQEGSLRPSQNGIALAKDVWLMGIGLGLVLDELSAEPRTIIDLQCP